MASHATLSVYVLETLLIFFILLRIFQARGGRELFIRRISGLNAIDEAIGRSTEMGKPLLYCFGMSGFGTEIYVPETLLQDAIALLESEDDMEGEEFQ